MLASFTSRFTSNNNSSNSNRRKYDNHTNRNFNDNNTSSSRTTKKHGKTVFLADYLTAFCNAGASSFLLTSKQAKRLQKSVGTNSYKLSGPHRLWFVVSVEEGVLRWSSQAYSEREKQGFHLLVH